ncbi:bifunctional glycosyltransferase/CDP-glycerol:glycerophosphate glycerophosphotransferase [Microbacterium sp. NPDC055903]
MVEGSSYEISLIVPIFNVETYLGQCLASIESQTVFARTEVVLVNDGSTDNSAAVAAAFADRHENVILIEQENGGLGAARNTGIAAASAPYLAFLDSDDVLPDDSLEIRLGAMDVGVDIVVGDMRTFPATTKWPWSAGLAEGSRELKGIEEFPELLSNASACNKLFRAEAFREAGFAEGRHFEDAFIVVPLLLAADRIRIVSEVVYLYRKRAVTGSIMDSLFTRVQNYWDHLHVAELVDVRSAGLASGRREAAELFLVRSMQGFLLRAPRVLDRDELRDYFERAALLFRGLDPEAIRNGTLNLHHRLPFAAMLAGDYQLFENPWSRIHGVERLVTGESVKVRPSLPEEQSDLLRLTQPQLFVERLEGAPNSDRLVVGGRVVLPGVPGTGLERTLRVRLASKGKPITSLGNVVVRREATVERPSTVVEWEVTAGKDSLRKGLHTLDAHLLIENGQFTIRARPSLGLLRSTRTIRGKSFRALLEPIGHDFLALRVQPNRRRLNRLRWNLLRAMNDVRAFVQRKPFGGYRVLRLVTRPLYLGKPIWLMSERGDTAQDNAYALFEWLRTSGEHVRPRFVLDRGSAGWSRLSRTQGVIRRGSVSHRLAVLHARVVISSQDIDAYLLPPQWDRNDFRAFLAYRLEQRRVFLQHGVIFNDVAESLAREQTGLDLFVTSIDQELDYLAARTRYTRELVKTGMPRYDLLSRESRRTVVLMPTWRKYLVLPSYQRGGDDPGTFEGSDYELFYSSFLQHPELVAVLEKHGIDLMFAPHYEVMPHFASLNLDAERIKLVDASGPRVRDLLASAAIFVTDYTSVMFDAAYIGIPVLQLPFDVEEFHARHYGRGWFDNEAGEYWPVARSVDEAIATLDRILSDGAAVEERYQEKIDMLFAHRDKENSRRVYEAIRALS